MEYYFVENIEGFDQLLVEELEYGEISPEHIKTIAELSDVRVLKAGDKVYSLDAGAYNLYLIKEDCNPNLDTSIKEFRSRDELLKLWESDEDQPFITDRNGVDARKYIESLPEDCFGIIYLYSTYDDFDCYGDGFTHYMKIIFNAEFAE